MLRRSQVVPLDEMNGPWVWLIVSDYDVAGNPTEEELFAALIEHDSFITDVHVTDASHGPYLVAAIRPTDFDRADAEEVERQFGDWIANEGPTIPLDPEEILSREIRPRLSDQECFMLQDLTQDRTFSARIPRRLAGG